VSDFEPPQSDQPPPETEPAYAPPAAAPAGAPAYGVEVGRVPERLENTYYSPGLVILLSIVTISVWTFLWVYRTTEDLKRYNGDGLGGVISVILHLFGVGNIALMFVIPNEIRHMYEHDGRQSPVSAVWGLWFLLPIIGWIIWYVKVQHALNDFWLSKGAQPG